MAARLPKGWTEAKSPSVPRRPPQTHLSAACQGSRGDLRMLRVGLPSLFFLEPRKPAGHVRGHFVPFTWPAGFAALFHSHPRYVCKIGEPAAESVVGGGMDAFTLDWLPVVRLANESSCACRRRERSRGRRAVCPQRRHTTSCGRCPVSNRRRAGGANRGIHENARKGYEQVEVSRFTISIPFAEKAPDRTHYCPDQNPNDDIQTGYLRGSPKLNVVTRAFRTTDRVLLRQRSLRLSEPLRGFQITRVAWSRMYGKSDVCYGQVSSLAR